MVLFGQHPSQGTLLKASQFLSEELPIRLSHRVIELESLPDGLSKMHGIQRVKEWYAESFQVSPLTDRIHRTVKRLRGTTISASLPYP